MKEILNFIDEGIQLCLFIHDGSLVYGKRIDDNISYDITQSQKELLKNVFYNILPSNYIKDLGCLKYGEKNINHLYDLKTNFHIFYEDNYQITKDVITLNTIFNNHQEYFASKEKNDKSLDKKYTKRLVKIGKKVLIVSVVSVSLITTSLVYIKGIQKIGSWVEYFKEEHKKNNYVNYEVQFEDIVEAINNNPNLTIQEKQFFLSCPSYFLDNLKYFDYYTIIDNLSNFSINYEPKSSDNVGTRAVYFHSGQWKYQMVIYESNDFNDSKKDVLSHEFLHLFTKQSNSFNHLYEGINAILNNEYFGNNTETIYDNSYASLKNYVYILAELIDPAVLRMYHANNNINYLIDNLVKIIPDEDLAINLLTDIDFIFQINNLKHNDQDNFLNLIDEYYLKITKVENTLKNYYEIKYQKSIMDDNYIFFLFKPHHAYAKIASELGFDNHAIRYADEFTRVKSYKKIFNLTDGSNDLILILCDEVKEVIKYYTMEQLLNGESDFHYDKVEDINFPLMPDGTYKGISYEPIHYIEYEVSNQIKKEIKNH